MPQDFLEQLMQMFTSQGGLAASAGAGATAGGGFAPASPTEGGTLQAPEQPLPSPIEASGLNAPANPEGDISGNQFAGDQGIDQVPEDLAQPAPDGQLALEDPGPVQAAPSDAPGLPGEPAAAQDGPPGLPQNDLNSLFEGLDLGGQSQGGIIQELLKKLLGGQGGVDGKTGLENPSSITGVRG